MSVCVYIWSYKEHILECRLQEGSTNLKVFVKVFLGLSVCVTHAINLCLFAVPTTRNSTLVAEAMSNTSQTAAALSQQVAIPKFGGDVKDFGAYLQDVEIWNFTTSMAAEKRGAALISGLSGNAKKVCEHLRISNVNEGKTKDGNDVGLPGQDIPGGVFVVLQTLRQAGYAAPRQQEHLSRLMDLMEFKRQEGMAMAEFTATFRQKRVKAAAEKMELPEAVAASLLLVNSNIDKMHHPTILGNVKGDNMTVETIAGTLVNMFQNLSVGAPSIMEHSINMIGDDLESEQDFDGDELLEIPMKSIQLDNDGKEVLVEQSVFMARHFFNNNGNRRFRGRGMFAGRGGNRFGGRGSRTVRRPTPGSSTRPVPDFMSKVVCWNCNQTGHLSRDCLTQPVNGEFQYVVSEIFLLNSVPSNAAPELVLDIGATMCVVGHSTVTTLQQHHPELKVLPAPQKANFSFGGYVKPSVGAVDVPVLLGKGQRTIRFAVVRDEEGYSLPFLISLSALIEMQAVIDLKSNPKRIELDGSSVESYVNNSNHLVIPLRFGVIHQPQNHIHTEFICHVTQPLQRIDIDPEVAKEIWRLHRVYGHPSPEKLIKFLASSSFQYLLTDSVRKFILQLRSECSTCVQSSSPKSVSKVCIPLSTRWNDVVAVDIMTWDGKEYLKIIDLFTRFLRIFPIRSRVHSELIAVLRDGWIANYGRFRRMFSDREFIGKEFQEFLEAQGITQLLSAAQSPESNAIVERHGGIVKKVMSKVRADRPNIPLNLLVQSAEEAHNALVNVDGYSPFQLVFGENPPIPSVLNHNLAQSDILSSNLPCTTSDRMKALLDARAAFVMIEADTRIHRALALPQPRDIPLSFSVGDMVFFHNDDLSPNRHGWFGPAKIIGIDLESRTVHIFYNRHYYTRHYSKIVSAPSQQLFQLFRASNVNSPSPLQTPSVGGNRPQVDSANTSNGGTKSVTSKLVHPSTLDPADIEFPSQQTGSELSYEETHQSHDKTSLHDTDSVESYSNDTSGSSESETCERQLRDPVLQSTTDIGESQPSPLRHSPLTAVDPSDHVADDTESYSSDGYVSFQSSPLRMVQKQQVPPSVVATEKIQPPRHRATEVERLTSTKLLQWRSGSIQIVDNGQLQCTLPEKASKALNTAFIAIDTAANTPEFILNTIQLDQTILSDDSVWIAAKQRELTNFRDFSVVDEMPVADFIQKFPDGQIVETKWVLKMKSMSEQKGDDALHQIQIPKARLVARGFQENVTDEITDAPTASKTAMRLVAFTAAQRKWLLNSLDIKTAFLQSDERFPEDPIIGIIPPPEANVDPDSLWILRKSMYGLRSAPKSWFKTLVNELKTLGFKQCVHDPAVFTLIIDGVFHGVISTTVDDLLYCGDGTFTERFSQIKKRFHIGSHMQNRFVHCGIEFRTEKDGSVHMSQREYIRQVEYVEIEDARAKELNSQLNATEKSQLRVILGALLWIATSTRSDICVDVSQLAGHLSSPTIANILAANKLLRYLKGSDTIELVYKHLGPNVRILAFSDSAFQNMPHSRSQGGQFIAFACEKDAADNANKTTTSVAAVFWQSQRLRRVVKSTLSAEVLSLSSTLDQAFWIRGLYNEILTGSSGSFQTPIDMKTDCESLVGHVKSLRNHPTEKRLCGDINMIREAITTGEIRSLQHIPTEYMVADGLTKVFHRLRKALTTAQEGSLELPEDGNAVQARHLK